LVGLDIEEKSTEKNLRKLPRNEVVQLCIVFENRTPVVYKKLKEKRGRRDNLGKEPFF